MQSGMLTIIYARCGQLAKRNWPSFSSLRPPQESGQIREWQLSTLAHPVRYAENEQYASESLGKRDFVISFAALPLEMRNKRSATKLQVVCLDRNPANCGDAVDQRRTADPSQLMQVI